MPKQVKLWGSVSILSTLLTFIILGVIGWSGVGTLKAYDTAIDVQYVKGQMDTMNESLREIIVLQHEKNTEIQKHSLRLDYCESHQKRCAKYMSTK